MIISWPARIKPSSVSDHVSAFWDILPTFCEITGIKPPEGIDGISFLQELKGKKQKEHEYLYWEFPESGGQQAVITGNYKARRKNMHSGNTRFELFDLTTDRVETVDIASSHPEIIQKVQTIIIKEHQKSQNDKWLFKQLDSK